VGRFIRYTGGDTISFADNQGVGYIFPVRDVVSLVLSAAGPALVVPEGTDIAIHTDETIDSENSSTGQLFSATVAEDVQKEYRVDTGDVDYSNKRGVGGNKRTPEYGGGGLLTRIFTRGKAVKVPAETLLRFRLFRTLVLRPGS
jgi:hypothetical protein